MQAYDVINNKNTSENFSAFSRLQILATLAAALTEIGHHIPNWQSCSSHSILLLLIIPKFSFFKNFHKKHNFIHQPHSRTS